MTIAITMIVGGLICIMLTVVNDLPSLTATYLIIAGIIDLIIGIAILVTKPQFVKVLKLLNDILTIFKIR